MTGDRDDGAGTWAAQLTDEQLLDELARVLRAAEPVPPEVVAAGQAAWTWRTVDAELAELIQDSASKDLVELALRSPAEEAVLRWLTFTASGVSIELEVTTEAVLGQLVPAQPATVTVELGPTGPVAAGSAEEPRVAVDEVGWFRLSPVPEGRFRLTCRTASGQVVVTAWISL